MYRSLARKHLIGSPDVKLTLRGVAIDYLGTRRLTHQAIPLYTFPRT